MELTMRGVDQQAQDKIRELPQQEQVALMRLFAQQSRDGQLQDPSKWLFAKARTILSRMAEERRSVRVQTFAGTVAELGGVALDTDAMGKLQELTDSERQELYAEFNQVKMIEGIKNPSGWIFGKARTKLVERRR